MIQVVAFNTFQASIRVAGHLEGAIRAIVGSLAGSVVLPSRQWAVRAIETRARGRVGKPTVACAAVKLKFMLHANHPVLTACS